MARIRNPIIKIDQMIYRDIDEIPLDRVFEDSMNIGDIKLETYMDGFRMLRAFEKPSYGSSDIDSYRMRFKRDDLGLREVPKKGDTTCTMIEDFIKEHYIICADNLNGLRILSYDLKRKSYHLNIEKTIKCLIESGESYGEARGDNSKLYQQLEIETAVNQDLFYGLNQLREEAGLELCDLIEDDELRASVKKLRTYLPFDYSLDGDIVVDVN